MDNSKMTPGRFLRMHQRKMRYAHIVSNLNAGRTVYICTALRAIKCTKKHVGLFHLRPSGVYIQMGKRLDCIDLCTIKIQ